MSLNYKMEIFALETDEGFEYVAHYPALKGVSGGGESRQEAIECLEENAIYYIEVLHEEGFPIPKEDLFEEPKKYSGTFSVRTTPDIHESLTNQAKQHGISLNSHINNIFSRYIGREEMLDDIQTVIKMIQDNIMWEHKPTYSGGGSFYPSDQANLLLGRSLSA